MRLQLGNEEEFIFKATNVVLLVLNVKINLNFYLV